MPVRIVRMEPERFEPLRVGMKIFDVQKDQGFQIGDQVVIEEKRLWHSTGRRVVRIVGWVERGDDLYGLGVHRGYCVIGFRPAAGAGEGWLDWLASEQEEARQ